MKLYNYYRSSASYRVRIALNIKNISYELIPINLINNDGEQFHPNYLRLNPQGLVPTLDENGHILSQSLAIIEYLEEICPEPSLLPQNPLTRSQVRSIAMMIACEIHPLNNLRVLQQLRQQFQADENQVNAWYHHWLALGFDAIEQRLENIHRKGAFCFGHSITLADVCLIPQVYNAKRYSFPMQNYPIINTIYDHCMTLDAFMNASPEKSSNP